MASPFPLQVLDEGAVRRWVFRARTALSANRDRLNQLNVFPVPDGDTGTNMYLTLHAALESLIGMYLSGGSGRILEGTQAMARSTLLAARGNSGVILSQLVRGLADVVTDASGAVARVDGIDGPMFARALRAASDRAWQGVSNPVEGTILTVAKAAADSAGAAASRDPRLSTVTAAALDGARTALAATPALLPSLAEAGVVDAGGAGYVLILGALNEIVTGQVAEFTLDLARLGVGLAAPARPTEPAGEQPDGAPGYEVMYLLDGCSEAEAEQLRADLLAIGDSVLVVGTPELRTVHVHTDEAGHAIEVGMAFGKVYGIRVTWLEDHRAGAEPAGPVAARLCPTGPIPPTAPVPPGASRPDLAVLGDSEPAAGGPASDASPVPDQDRRPPLLPPVEPDPRSRPDRTSGVAGVAAAGPDSRAAVPAVDEPAGPAADQVGVVACVPGPGLAQAFQEVGAVVVPCGPGTRATPQELLAAVLHTGRPGVVILPNDRDALLAADVAAELAAEHGVLARVVRTEWAVQGVAALAVYQAGDTQTDVVDRMTEAAGQVRPGMVALASRSAVTEAGECHPGDALGFLARRVAVVGSDLLEVAREVAGQLVAPRTELLTLVSGAGSADLAERLEDVLMQDYPDLEVVRMDGGQEVYALLLGAE